MKVKDPSGASYGVSRRWLPWRWRRRVSGRPWDGADSLSGLGGVDDLAGLLIAIVAGIVLVLVLPIIVLVLLTGVEFLLLLVVLPIAVIARLIFGKHWQVEVREGRRVLYEVDGGDWAQSRALIEELAHRISLGQLEQGRLLGTAADRATRRSRRAD